MTWLTSSVVHSDPRGTSPDMSMTPAPVTPASCGNTAHSRAADNPSPPAPSSAKIRRSLSPGILGTPAPARVRPAPDSAETTHLLAPSPRKEASARTGLNASHSPDTGPLVANITPQPYREQLSPACGRPADCDTGSSPGGQSTKRGDQRSMRYRGSRTGAGWLGFVSSCCSRPRQL